MTLTLTRLLLDVGLVVLIWMVQLVVYPSFSYYAKEELIAWHKKYTLRIGILVAPLMSAQLLVAGWQWYISESLLYGVGFLLVVLVWFHTLLLFVPLHAKISNGNANKALLEKLCTHNWWRTLLWSAILSWSLILLAL